MECYLTEELFNVPEIPDDVLEGMLGCSKEESLLFQEKWFEEQATKVRDNYHTVLIAKNYEGVKEINLLIDKSTQQDHFYYKPRITFDEFLNISDNVIKISACLASPLNKIRDIDRVEKLCKHYDYYEIQPHINSNSQKEYNKYLIELSKKYNKPLIAGTDTHSLNKYKAKCRSILQKSKHIEFSNEDEFDLTYKSYDELVEMFEKQGVVDKNIYLQAIENTNIMADSVETFTLDTSFKYPKLYDNEEQVLKQRIAKMLKDKIDNGIIEDNPQYENNIVEEFEVFKKINMIGFMLFMSELIMWCWENDIPVGYCRGSVGGSTIAFITDIIDVDPVKWHTVFSRFANEDRLEIGDIDVDIAPSQRVLVYQHIIDSFGIDNTAYILAIGTISDKGTIDEIGRALSDKWLNNNENYLKEIKSLNQEIKDLQKKGEFYGTWEVEIFESKRIYEISDRENPYSLDKIANIKLEYENNPQETIKKYPDIFYYFDGLLNTAISQSMHPAGIVVSPISLPDNYGTFWADGKRILSVNMEEVHEVSLVKYDILGLKNIEIIDKTCKYANIPYPKSNLVNWEDQKVWKDIISSPYGIFQFEGDYAYRLLKDFVPTCVNDLSLVNASLRPSGASYRDKLLARIPNKNPSKMIDDLLADNNGFLVFQEDTLKFLKDICGLSGSDADNVRRAIGRKQIDRLQAALPQILEGYCEKSTQPRDVAEQEAKAFLQIIEDSSNYQFGFNHSTGYSMIGYVCGLLRYYYPAEFITAYLNCANNSDDIKNGSILASTKNIQIHNIKFRYSRSEYAIDKSTNSIYKGISSVKYCNSQIADELYELRYNKYETFTDLLVDISKTSIDKRKMEILILTDFFEEFGNSKQLMFIYEWYINFKKLEAKSFKKDKFKDEIIKNIIERFSCVTETSYTKLKCYEILSEIERFVKLNFTKDYPVSYKVSKELEFLGYITYKTNKDSDRNKILVLTLKKCISKFEKNQGKPWAVQIEGYSIGSGKKSNYTIMYSKFSKDQFVVDDVIAIDDWSRNKNGYFYIDKYHKIDKNNL